MPEVQVQSLGQEDPPGGRSGNPLQYSRLGNPVDGGASWATPRGRKRVGHNLVIKEQHLTH